MNRTIVATGAVLGLLAVVLGALASHSLRDQIPASSLESFQTAVQYQMYHGLFLLVLGVQRILHARDRKIVFGLVLSGVICFSLSIYLLSTKALTGLDFSPFGWITPLGGLLMISGWCWLLYRVIRSKGK